MIYLDADFSLRQRNIAGYVTEDEGKDAPKKVTIKQEESQMYLSLPERE